MKSRRATLLEASLFSMVASSLWHRSKRAPAADTICESSATPGGQEPRDRVLTTRMETAVDGQSGVCSKLSQNAASLVTVTV